MSLLLFLSLDYILLRMCSQRTMFKKSFVLILFSLWLYYQFVIMPESPQCQGIQKFVKEQKSFVHKILLLTHHRSQESRILRIIPTTLFISVTRRSSQLPGHSLTLTLIPIQLLTSPFLTLSYPSHLPKTINCAF